MYWEYIYLAYRYYYILEYSYYTWVYIDRARRRIKVLQIPRYSIEAPPPDPGDWVLCDTDGDTFLLPPTEQTGKST